MMREDFDDKYLKIGNQNSDSDCLLKFFFPANPRPVYLITCFETHRGV